MSYRVKNFKVMKLADMTSMHIQGSVSVQDLGGTGNAFVCVDPAGKLYRSAIACR